MGRGEQTADRGGDRLLQRGPGEFGTGDAQADDAVQLLKDQRGGEERPRIFRVGADARGHPPDQLLVRLPAGKALRCVVPQRQRGGEHQLIVPRGGQPELAVDQGGGQDPLARVGFGDLVLPPDQLAEEVVDRRHDQRVNVVEVQVHRGRGHADLAGDGAQRQRRRGRVGQQPAGGLDDVIAQPLALTARVPLPGLGHRHRDLLALP